MALVGRGLEILPVPFRNGLRGEERGVVAAVSGDRLPVGEQFLDPPFGRVFDLDVRLQSAHALYVFALLLVGNAREDALQVLLEHVPQLRAEELDSLDRRVGRHDIPQIPRMIDPGGIGAPKRQPFQNASGVSAVSLIASNSRSPIGASSTVSR